MSSKVTTRTTTPTTSSARIAGNVNRSVTNPSLDWRSRLKQARRSCLVTINNETNLTLELHTFSASAGSWTKEPPSFISPGSSAEFGSEGKSHMTGTKADACYRAKGCDGEFLFQWKNPKMKRDTLFCNVPWNYVLVMNSKPGKLMEIEFSVRVREGDAKGAASR
eukprot:TRINITY_DN2921_c0_g1_i1.p1 TRINITY_DN2921_c0_g1~~TRINITY_DN2921_c0_g1_i1.p1  ORF type:complete len:165 (-),score=23.45 TRINITY_DN2921_c0_g1_i1:208-702(-)